MESSSSLNCSLRPDFPSGNLRRHGAKRSRQLSDFVVAGGQWETSPAARPSRRPSRASPEARRCALSVKTPQGQGDPPHEDNRGQRAEDEEQQQKADHLPNPSPDGFPDGLAVHADVNVAALSGKDGAANVDAVAQARHGTIS